MAEYSESLRRIMRHLEAGHSYTEWMDSIKYPGWWWVLNANKEYIFWRHYGQSANDKTLGDLGWIIREIFKMTPVEFENKYTPIVWENGNYRVADPVEKKKTKVAGGKIREYTKSIGFEVVGKLKREKDFRYGFGGRYPVWTDEGRNAYLGSYSETGKYCIVTADGGVY